MAGFLVVGSSELSERLRFILKTTGSALSPFDSWLILRGIKTLPIRMERAQENAFAIAAYLQTEEKVRRVYYPGIEGTKGYELCRSQATGFGSMLTFEVESRECALRILKQTKLIPFAESLGGVETLLTYPATQTHADVPEEERIRGGITDRILRLSVGIESAEHAVAENQVKLFLLCSPHNPAGRVWREEELDMVLDICRRHDVLVCSDEIHQDFTFDGKNFVPALMVSGGKYRDRLITVNSASKTFNLASLLHAQLIISDKRLRDTYDRKIRGRNQTELSLMGMTAAQAGYEGGEEWLEALKGIIWDNYQYLKTELGRELPEAVVYSMEGTYLPLIDLRGIVESCNTKAFIQGKCCLAVDYGEWFGKNFRGFIRLNMATDPALVREAVRRIVSSNAVF